MPMAAAAAETTGADPAASLPSLPMPPQGAPPPSMPPTGGSVMPTAQASPASAAAPVQAGPPPVPYQTKMQADGSVAAYIPSPDGDPSKDVIIGVAPAFKVPKAFAGGMAPQVPAPAAQPPVM